MGERLQRLATKARDLSYDDKVPMREAIGRVARQHDVRPSDIARTLGERPKRKKDYFLELNRQDAANHERALLRGFWVTGNQEDI